VGEEDHLHRSYFYELKNGDLRSQGGSVSAKPRCLLFVSRQKVSGVWGYAPMSFKLEEHLKQSFHENLNKQLFDKLM
jgi:hypothetical protein